MIETLSSLFQKSKGMPVNIDGDFMWPIFQEKILDVRKKLLIRRVSSAISPIQGLRIKVLNGTIEVNEQSHSEIILWSDTSPELVEIIISSKSGCELKVWNVWKIDGIIQAWVGNAGINIDKTEKVVTLKCSDGTGEVDLSNLIIQLEHND